MAGKITTRKNEDGTLVYTTVVNLPPNPNTGKRKQVRITRTIKRELEAERARIITAHQAGAYNSAAGTKQSVEAFLAVWLKHAASNVRPQSVNRYAEMVRLHIAPEIGKVRLASLTPQQVGGMYTTLLTKSKPLSRTSVNAIHAMFHHALDQAVRWGLVVRNVTDMVDPPSRDNPERAVWSGEQLRLFLDAASKDAYGSLWRLAVYTGMRRGELLGLQWADVDMERGVVAVKRSYSRGSGNKYEMGQPKTHSSRRQIAIPASTVQDLQAHFIKQMDRRLELGADYLDQGLVFADDIGRPVHPNTLADHFAGVIKRAGIPKIRIHDLRHGHATMLMEHGTHPKVVSERLGHANTGITMDLYSHVTPSMQRVVSDNLDTFIGGEEGAGRKQ